MQRRRKEVFYLAGDPAENLLLLEEGLVRIVELLPDGRQITLRHVLPGDYFGEEALEGGRHRYTAEVLIADATASTRESVSKILSDLRRDGLIETAYRRVYLLNPQALTLEAEGELEAA